MGRHRQARCNWGNEKKILSQCSDRKWKMPEESITVLGRHLQSLEKPESWLRLAPCSCELFAAYKSTELSSLVGEPWERLYWSLSTGPLLPESIIPPAFKILSHKRSSLGSHWTTWQLNKSFVTIILHNQTSGLHSGIISSHPSLLSRFFSHADLPTSPPHPQTFVLPQGFGLFLSPFHMNSPLSSLRSHNIPKPLEDLLYLHHVRCQRQERRMCEVWDGGGDKA